MCFYWRYVQNDRCDPESNLFEGVQIIYKLKLTLHYVVKGSRGNLFADDTQCGYHRFGF